MSFRRYCSRTTFWTFPLRVDRRKTLLVICPAFGSDARPRLRLFIVANGVEIAGAHRTKRKLEVEQFPVASMRRKQLTRG